MVMFISDRMSYIVLRGRWYCITVLNAHVPEEDKTDNVMGSFYMELEHVVDKLPKCHMKIWLEDFNATAGGEDIFKQIIKNENLHEISNDNGVRVVNFTTNKSFSVKSKMFSYCNKYKYTWTSQSGKTHNHIHHILTER
jgi:hypothetical protein